MSIANIGSKWVNGNQVFFSKLTGQEILVFDAENEKIIIPEGSGIDIGGESYIVTAPDGATLEVDEDSGKLQVKDTGIDEDKLAASVAGDGLTGGAGDALAVAVDDASIEIDDSTGKLQIKNQEAIDDLGITVSEPPTQTEVQAVADKLDALLAALRLARILGAGD